MNEDELPYEASVMSHDLTEMMDSDETTLGDLRKYCIEMHIDMQILFTKEIP